MGVYMFMCVYLDVGQTCVEAIRWQLMSSFALNLTLNLLLVCVHVCVPACVWVHVCVCMYLVESLVSFHFYVGSGDQIKVGRIYQMSSWSSILFFIFERLSFYFYFVCLSILPACMCMHVVPSKARVSDLEVKL